MARDTRAEVFLALRTLRRSPRFAFFALLLLALGIGANVGVFHAVYQALWRPLPYPDPDRLAALKVTSVWSGEVQQGDWSYPWLRDLAASPVPLAQIAAYQSLDLGLESGGDPERISLEVVSGSYFPLLGLEPAFGRTFAGPGLASAVQDTESIVLSHDLWRRRFGADTSILGQTVRLNRMPVSVVGVLPAGFRGLSGTAEAWAPLELAPRLYHPAALESPFNFWLQAIARVSPGVSPESATPALAAAVGKLAVAYPLPVEAEVTWGATASRLADSRTDPRLTRSLFLIGGVCLAVLVLAVIHLALLFRVRAARRQQALEIRAALGSSRRQLTFHALVEACVLGSGAMVLGMFLGQPAFAWIHARLPELDSHWVPSLGVMQLGFLPGGTTLFFCFLIGALATLGCSLPAVSAAQRCRPSLLLTQLSGERVIGRKKWWFHARSGGRSALLAGSIAITLMLLVATAQTCSSLIDLLRVKPGVDPDGVLSFRLEPSRQEYPDGTAGAELQRRLIVRLGALPGVAGVSVDQCAPLSGDCPTTLATYLEGIPSTAFTEAPQVEVHPVGPDHFTTLGVRVLEGRGFATADAAGAPRIAVLNREAARRLFAGREPIGKRLALANGLFRAEGATAEVVGVVDDVRYAGPTDPPAPAVYLSALQYSPAASLILIKTRLGNPTELLPAVRRAVAEVDRHMPIFAGENLAAAIDRATLPQRTTTTLLVVLATFALALAVAGVYGVVSATVVARRRELAVRLAIGADRACLLRYLRREALWASAVGMLAGLAGVWGLGRTLPNLGADIGPIDFGVTCSAALLLAGVAWVAADLPARRALALDPAIYLRSE